MGQLFLAGPQAWLAAIAGPITALNFRPVDELVSTANQRLFDVEGRAFEKLVGVLYEERSRKRVGDFGLTKQIQGYWDGGQTEIDLVALDETNSIIRFGSCKRTAKRLLSDMPVFEGHVDRFLKQFPKFAEWTIQRVCLAPQISDELRQRLETSGRIAEDLCDLTADL